MIKKRYLFFGLILFFTLTVKSFAIDCKNYPELWEDKSSECYTTCTEEDILDNIPGCFSQGMKAPDKDLIDDQMNGEDIREETLRIVNYFLGFLGFVAVVLLVYSGAELVFKGEGAKEDALNRIKYIVLGIIIIFLSYSFVNFILGIGDSDKSSPSSNNDNQSVNEHSQENEDTNVSNQDIENNLPIGSDTDFIDVNQEISQDIKNLINNLKNTDLETQKLFDYLKNPTDLAYKLMDLADSYNLNKDNILAELKNYYFSLSEKEKENFKKDLLKKYSKDFVETLIHFLETGKRLKPEDEEKIKKSMESQNYSSELTNNLLDKINKNEELSENQLKTLKNALSYGNNLLLLETKLKNIYETMPQTSSNMIAYNNVLTILKEVKSTPEDERLVYTLKNEINDLLKIVNQTPKMIARISAEPGSGEAPLIVTFDGSDSVDPNDVTIPTENYLWTYYDNQGNEKTIGKGPIIEYLFEEAGVYIVNLKVSTNIKSNGYKTVMDGRAKVKIKVRPQSSDLKVQVNGDSVYSSKKIHIDDALKGVRFDASSSNVQIGRKIKEYQWFFGDGSSDVSLNGEPILHKYNKIGTYKVQLKAIDNTSETLVKNFKIIVEKISAQININQKEGKVKENFVLNAYESRSSTNSINNYYWSIINEKENFKKESEEKEFSFVPEIPGEYFVKLIVKDSSMEQSIDTLNISVKSREPSANFSFTKPFLNKPAYFEFNAKLSSDPDLDKLTYSWDFDGDNIFEIKDSKDAKQTYLYQEKGDFNVILKVKDEWGEEDIIKKNLTVKSLLNVDLEIKPQAIQKDKEITFVPSSNTGIYYYWDFGDGTNMSTKKQEIKKSYQKSGTYNVKLTVFNEDDEEIMITKPVFIGDSDYPVSAFEVSLDGNKVYPQENVCGEDLLGIEVTRKDFIKFSASPSINIDGKPYMLDYIWNFGDGNFGNTKTVTYRYSELTNDEDCFPVTLKVKDRVSKKESQTKKFYVKVKNMEPSLQNLVIYEKDKKINGERITPYTVNLRAQKTSDPDGVIKSYRWWYRNINDPKDTKKGLIKTQEPFSDITILSEGISGLENEYVFVVELRDNEGSVVNSEELLGKSTSLLVKNGNVNAPKIDFMMDNNQIYVDDTISFFVITKDLTAEEKNLITYEWDFNGDSLVDETTKKPQISRKFKKAGEYEVKLRAKIKGLSSSVKKTVYVESITRYPLAAFTYQTNELQVFFDASTSRYDPVLEDKNLQYVWDFNVLKDSDGDGVKDNDEESLQMNPNYQYEKSGNYFVKLTVTDSKGSIDTVKRQVKVEGEKTEDFNNSNLKKTSPKIISKNMPITSLNLATDSYPLIINKPVKLKAIINNADGSLYEGEVEFVIDSDTPYAYLDKDLVKANNGSAETVINPFKEGNIKIIVTAKNTYYQNLTETLSLKIIRNKEKEALKELPLNEENKAIREVKDNLYNN